MQNHSSPSPPPLFFFPQQFLSIRDPPEPSSPPPLPFTGIKLHLHPCPPNLRDTCDLSESISHSLLPQKHLFGILVLKDSHNVDTDFLIWKGHVSEWLRSSTRNRMARASQVRILSCPFFFWFPQQQFWHVFMVCSWCETEACCSSFFGQRSF